MIHSVKNRSFNTIFSICKFLLEVLKFHFKIISEKVSKSLYSFSTKRLVVLSKTTRHFYNYAFIDKKNKITFYY